MHTEHLRNVHPAWAGSAWLIAVATTSAVALVLAAIGLVGPEANGREGVWAVVTVAVGFWTGGFAIGYRAIHAPILHGIAVGLTSLVAWLPLNFLVNQVLDLGPWEALTPRLTVALLLVQMIAAVGGTWSGYRLAGRGTAPGTA